MKAPTRAQRIEWAAKLKASGFEDLETGGETGPLSNRGRPTRLSARELAPGERIHEPTLEERAETAAYYEWAKAAAKSHRFASRMERCIWRLHADQVSDHVICDMLGVLSYRQVRAAIDRTSAAIKERQAEEVNQVKQVNQQSRTKVRRKVDSMVRRMDLGLLLAVAGRLA